MGKKKTNSKRKSELRIIFFIILVAAVLFIISTYAWFSTQRNVSINNLSGTVEVAEGLEISLNGKVWRNELVLGDGPEQFNITDSSTDYGPYEGHRNIMPKEMLPVSTLGRTATKTEKDLTMIRGKVTNSIELSEIVEMDESLIVGKKPDEQNSGNAAFPGYIAFDIFLKNSSKSYTDFDVLQLNYDSSLKIIEDGNSDSGLQNTVRVALAKYGTGEVESGEGMNIIRKGAARVNAEQPEILNKTGAVDSGDDVYITDVAIWEPNASDHVQYIVDNNNTIKWSTENALKYSKTLANGKTGFDITTQMPTYALKESSLAENTVIKDIYAWNDTETHVQEQVVLQTTNTKDEETGAVTDYKIEDGVQNLISVTNTKSSTNALSQKERDELIPLSIAPNSVVRLRVYVWLEGQDVDCINYASHGGGVTIDLGLVKGSTTGSHETDIIE